MDVFERPSACRLCTPAWACVRACVRACFARQSSTVCAHPCDCMFVSLWVRMCIYGLGDLQMGADLLTRGSTSRPLCLCPRVHARLRL